MGGAFKKFDILDYPLDGGKVLIEAAAGSGKTYTIQYLFLRLILERSELEAGNILVVTFTEAATEELKERIRTTLRAAAKLLAWISKDRPLDPEKDGDLGRVLAQALKKGHSASFLRARLQQVRAAFDEVVIATIHGFCNRILSDYAFACGARVDVELVKESRYFLQLAAADYWRRTFYRASAALVETAQAEGLKVEGLIKLGEQLDRDPDLTILPEQPEAGSWAADIARIEAEIAAAAAAYQRDRLRALSYVEQEAAEIERLLFEGSPLKANSWKPDQAGNYINDLAAALNTTSWPDKESLKILEKFSQEDLVKKKKKSAAAPVPEHPLFNLCEELIAAAGRRNQLASDLICALQRDFLDFALSPSGLRLYKEKSRKQGYSDYLTGLDRILKGPAGPRLQGLVRERFKVALVDEFQDTDPIQSSIFNTLFDHPDTLFYRIGDPKQSIYGFRGADIHAYLAAAREPGQQLATLDYNYRSTPELLEVFNRIFSIPKPFLLKEIEFRKMACGKPAAEQKELLIDGEVGKALYFWSFAVDRGQLNKNSALSIITNAVADSCVELLTLAREPRVAAGAGDSRRRAEIAIGGTSFRPLKASDIAILTSKNREAAQIWQACQQRNVPAVVAAAENIWETPEAAALFHFLQAQLSPEDDYLLSTALAGAFFDYDGDFLATVHADERPDSPVRKEYELWRQAFYAGRQLWLEQGIMALLAGFPDFSGDVAPVPEFDLRLNLARSTRGERALTNFYHLQEILHQAEFEHRFGPEMLLNWLHEHLTGESKDEDEYELRLESEADTVKIMTVHKSKGLEFPVVFAPFLWSRSFISTSGRSEAPVFHKPVSADGDDISEEVLGGEVTQDEAAAGFRRYLDLNPDSGAEHRQLQQAEELAESLRLCYVAMTRAEMRLYLAMPQTKDSGKTALMYLLRPPQSEPERQEFLTKGGPAAGPELLDDFAAGAEDEIVEIVRNPSQSRKVILPAAPVAAAALEARQFERQLPARSGWLSFSSLTAGTHGGALNGAAQTGHPATGKLVEKVKILPVAEELNFAAFPGGTATGNAIHQIFEELDFHRAASADWQHDAQVETLVRDTLAHFNLIVSGSEDEARMVGAVLKMLDRVLNVPLPNPCGSLKLSRPDLALRREMEFCLPVAGRLSATEITAILRPGKLSSFNQLEAETRSRWRLDFPESLPAAGYLNGFIDLVFAVDNRYYLLDWKTNNLGPDYCDYSLEALQRNMLQSDYLLQYNLYLVALNRFLEKRLENYDYETNFGGVYYLYVRGINGRDDSTGIFYDRPEYETVSKLMQAICGDT